MERLDIYKNIPEVHRDFNDMTVEEFKEFKKHNEQTFNHIIKKNFESPDKQRNSKSTLASNSISY